MMCYNEGPTGFRKCSWPDPWQPSACQLFAHFNFFYCLLKTERALCAILEYKIAKGFSVCLRYIFTRG